MAVAWRVFPLLLLALLSQAGQAAGEMSCDRLARIVGPAEFEAMMAGLGNSADRAAETLGACGLDYQALRYRQCQQAFRRENLDFVLRYCPEEAWSLARAQCERQADTVTSRYAEFCRLFHTGTAPTYGR